MELSRDNERMQGGDDASLLCPEDFVDDISFQYDSTDQM